MTPVYRVILPNANVPNDNASVNARHNLYVVGSSSDYITSDSTWPAQAQYVARLNADGTINVLVARSVAFTPSIEHTYAGWPIPA